MIDDGQDDANYHPPGARTIDQGQAGSIADRLIQGANEIVGLNGVFDYPTGEGQLMRAAMAQLGALQRRQVYTKAGIPKSAFAVIPDVFPKDWRGFRDYGTDVANIVVAIALLRKELKRKITNGEGIQLDLDLPLAKEREIVKRALAPKPTPENKP